MPAKLQMLAPRILLLAAITIVLLTTAAILIG
jgi:hypothetical protein